jgi:hypothetical protein
MIPTDAFDEWIPAVVVVATLLTPLMLIRWMPQIAGRIGGAKPKLSTLLVGVGIICFIAFSIFSADRDVCLLVSVDAKFECEMSRLLMIAVLFWFVLVALSQIRLVIAACAAVTARQARASALDDAANMAKGS